MDWTSTLGSLFSGKGSTGGGPTSSSASSNVFGGLGGNTGVIIELGVLGVLFILLVYLLFGRK